MEISGWGSNVYVKIPITNTPGRLRQLLAYGIEDQLHDTGSLEGLEEFEAVVKNGAVPLPAQAREARS
jgi:hypothetical protein